MIIQEAIDWVVQNPVLVTSYALQGIGAATVLFRSLVNLTDTKADNKALRVLLKFLEKVSFNKDTGKLTINVKRDKKE
jgi:hypothetical protein